jgi:hypothetical protein
MIRNDKKFQSLTKFGSAKHGYHLTIPSDLALLVLVISTAKLLMSASFQQSIKEKLNYKGKRKIPCGDREGQLCREVLTSR